LQHVFSSAHRNVSLLLGRIKARRRVKFAEGSSLTPHAGGGPTVAAA